MNLCRGAAAQHFRILVSRTIFSSLFIEPRLGSKLKQLQFASLSLECLRVLDLQPSLPSFGESSSGVASPGFWISGAYIRNNKR